MRFLLPFVLVVSTAKADISTYAEYRNPSVALGAQPVVELRVPASLINQAIQQTVAKKNSALKSLEDIQFSPVNGLIRIRGKFVLPPAALMPLSQVLEDDKARTAWTVREFDFELAFTPKVVATSKNTYLNIQLEQVTLDGVDLLQSIPLAMNLAKIFLASADLGRFIQDKVDPTGKTQVDRFLDKKNIYFNEALASIRINVNVLQFVDLSRFKGMKDYASLAKRLRLWFLRPIVLEQTSDVALYIAAGLGVPKSKNSDWLRDQTRYHERVGRAIVDARKTEYQNHSDQKSYEARLQQIVSQALSKNQLFDLEYREAREVEKFVRAQKEFLGHALNPKNANFLAGSKSQYDRSFTRVERSTAEFFSDLVRRHQFVREAIAYKAKSQRGAPFLTQTLSQKALTGFLNFFRDIILARQTQFKNLQIMIQPALPGLIVQGIYSIDLAKFSKIGLGVKELRLNRDLYGEGIPFSLSIRTFMTPDGWLRLDVDNMRLFGGAQALKVDRTSPLGGQLFDLTKRLLSTSFAQLAIKQRPASSPADQKKKQEQRRAQVRQNIGQLVELYKTLNSRAVPIKALIATDVKRNPFILAGKENAKSRVKARVGDRVRYDRGSLMVALEPSLVAGPFPFFHDDVRVWNFEPIYSSRHGQTFMEMALGSGNRSTEYSRRLRSRPENMDSQRFVAEKLAAAQNPLDIRYAVSLSDLSRTANRVFSEIGAKQRVAAGRLLSQDQAQKYFTVNDFNIRPAADDRMEAKIDLTVKEKRFEEYSDWFPWNWFRSDKWVVDEYDIKLRVIFGLTTVASKNYANLIKAQPNKIFLGDQALRVDLYRVGLEHGQYNWVGSLLGILGIDWKDIDLRSNGLLVRAARGVINRIVAPMLNDPNNDGNTVLGKDFHLNEFAKVFLLNGNPQQVGDLIVQLNPRMTTVAFDLRLVKNHIRGGERVGVVLDPANDQLRLDFEVRSGVANVDKRELMAIIQKSRALFGPYLRAKTGAELLKLLKTNELFDQTFYNSDISRMSLFHRFLAVLSQYPNAVDVSAKELARLKKFLNRKYQVRDHQTRGPNRWISETGVELMYFTSALFPVYTQLDQLLKKIIQHGLTQQLEKGNYLHDFIAKHKEMANRFLRPMLVEYEKNYRLKNQQIVSAKVSDWTYKVYPDALFASSAYRHLVNEAKKLSLLGY